MGVALVMKHTVKEKQSNALFATIKAIYPAVITRWST